MVSAKQRDGGVAPIPPASLKAKVELDWSAVCLVSENGKVVGEIRIEMYGDKWRWAVWEQISDTAQRLHRIGYGTRYEDSIREAEDSAAIFVMNRARAA